VVEAASNGTPAEIAGPAPEAPATEVAPTPQRKVLQLPKPKAYVVYIRRNVVGYSYRRAYYHCD